MSHDTINTSSAPLDLGGSNYLIDLAARINAEHTEIVHALKAGIEHSITAGDLLIEAKAKLKHGQWLPWLREHCIISERTASLYMRLARHAPELKAKSATVADLTIRAAVQALTPHADTDDDEQLISLPPLPLNPGEIEKPIDAIKFDPELYPRLQMIPELVARYRHFLRYLPAIEINQRDVLIDGWHRLEAFKQSGAKTVRVRITNVENDLDHLERACIANATGGLQLPLSVERERKEKREREERQALSIAKSRDDAIVDRVMAKEHALKRSMKELAESIRTCDDLEFLTFLAKDTTLMDLVVERQMYAQRELGKLLNEQDAASKKKAVA